MKFCGFTNHEVALRYNVSFMYLSYKSSAPKNMNKLFDPLASNGIERNCLQIQMPSKFEILPPAETKPAIKRLLNHDKNFIDTTDELFDVLYTSKNSLYEISLCIDYSDKIFDDFLECIFSKSIEDHDLPLSQNVNACKD